MNPKVGILRSIFYKKIYEHKKLSEVINYIRSNEMKEKYNKAHSIKNDQKKYRQYKKSELGVFIPSYYTKKYRSHYEDPFFESTGLIHFDFDLTEEEKNKGDKSRPKKLIGKLKACPFLKYAFTSISGGVKFAIQTDFITVDADSFGSTYKQAYDIAKKTLEEKYDIDDELDDSVKSNHTCFYSYDSKAIYIENPSILNIKKKLELHEDIIEYKSYSNGNIDEADIKEMLSFIPKNLNFEERRKINFSVLSEIGSLGIPMLLEHWNKDSKIIRAQLKSQLKSDGRNSSNKISIGTLYHSATENGYKANKIETFPETYPNARDELFSAENIAKNELAKSFKNIDDNRNHAFLIECGIGKTYQTLLQIIDYLVKNPFHKITYYVQNHELAEQVYKQLSEHSENKFIQENNLQAKLNTKVKIAWIRSRDDLCELKRCNPERNITSNTCLTCPLKTEGCEYIEQFNRYSQVRIEVHNNLYNEPSMWDNGYHFDTEGLVKKPYARTQNISIIDESFMDKATTEVEYSDRQLSATLKQFKSLIETRSDLRNFLLENKEIIHKEYFDFEKEIDNFNSKIKKAETIESVKKLLLTKPVSPLIYEIMIKAIKFCEIQEEDKAVTVTSIDIVNNKLVAGKINGLIDKVRN